MAQEEEIRYFVRIGTTDLDGTKSVRVALTGIKGVGRHTSTVISRMAKVDEYAKARPHGRGVSQPDPRRG